MREGMTVGYFRRMGGNVKCQSAKDGMLLRRGYARGFRLFVDSLRFVEIRLDSLILGGGVIQRVNETNFPVNAMPEMAGTPCDAQSLLVANLVLFAHRKGEAGEKN
jgi:hypothetical protein